MKISKQATDHHHKDESDECNSSTKEVVAVEELILKILLCLPPISVLRFKSVCKNWYSLISTPSFLRNHARQFHLQRDRLDPIVVSGLLFSSSEADILPFDQYSEYAILPQDDQDNKPLLKTLLDHSLSAFKKTISSCLLVDSCNGLLLYRYEDKNLGLGLQYQYVVFNPITHQFKEVPIMDLLQTFEAEDEVNEIDVCDFPHIVFDPSISLSYKVITCLHREDPCSHYAFYFYSADTNSWTLLTSFDDDEDDWGIGRKTFMFDGVFYWLKHDVSICFDAVKENVWFLPLPPIPSDCYNRDVVYFGECNGRLRLIEEYKSIDRNDGWNFPCSFDIMEMDLGSKIWTVKSRVNFESGYDHLVPNDPLYCGVVKVVHHYQTEKGEEAILLSVDYEKLVSFNLTTNTFGKEFTIPYKYIEEDIEDYRYLKAFPFTPTLFPLLT